METYANASMTVVLHIDEPVWTDHERRLCRFGLHGRTAKPYAWGTLGVIVRRSRCACGQREWSESDFERSSVAPDPGWVVRTIQTTGAAHVATG